jgi:hypothetical protein
LAVARYRPLVATKDLRRRVFASVFLIAAVFTVLQAIDYRKDTPSNDTYQYAKQTLRVLGDTQAQAVHDATVMYCQDSGTSAATGDALTSGGGSAGTDYASAFDACLHVYRNGLTPTAPRYLAIFTSRPGYPLLAAPIAAVFGLRFGLWAAALLCTLLASLLVIALLREAGCGWRAALGGQALLLAAPSGYWGSRMLTDGPSLATTLLALLGAVWMAKGRIRPGAGVLAAGLVTGFLVRYSSEQLAALLLALGALISLRWVRGARTPGVKALALAAGAGFVLSELASALLGWPGLTESMQDTFTKHFLRPDVPDPVQRLIQLDLHFWGYYPVSEPTALLAVVGLIALAVALVRRDAVYGLLVVAAAATGVGAVVAHPLASQADRLMMPVWLVLALGLPLLLDRTGASAPAIPGAREPQEPPEPRPVRAQPMRTAAAAAAEIPVEGEL